MNVKSAKTVILVLLILGVIIQTGQLWFEKASDHNFFYSFLPTKNRVSDESYKIEPERIFVNLGNTKFVPMEVDQASALKLLIDAQLTQMLKNGTFIEQRPINWLESLEQKSVVYSYPVSLSAEAYADSFQERARGLRSMSLSFDTLIIKPARTSSEALRVYLIDQAQGTESIFDIPKAPSEEIVAEINQMEVLSKDQLYYVSSEQNTLNFFKGNTFLPQWRDSSFLYSKISAKNPIETSSSFESCVALFFDNPVGIITSVDESGIPQASDSETVIKYNRETEILEYNNYAAIDKTPCSLPEAYTAAVNFMKRDSTLQNSVVLSNAVLDGDIWRLYFNYTINSVPVFVFEPSSLNMTVMHAIEITVEGNAVTKYRRLVKEIALSKYMGVLSDNFLDVLDTVLANEALLSEGQTIDDLKLGYNIMRNGENDLRWFVKIHGTWLWYFQEIQPEEPAIAASAQ